MSFSTILNEAVINIFEYLRGRVFRVHTLFWDFTRPGEHRINRYYPCLLGTHGLIQKIYFLFEVITLRNGSQNGNRRSKKMIKF